MTHRFTSFSTSSSSTSTSSAHSSGGDIFHSTSSFESMTTFVDEPEEAQSNQTSRDAVHNDEVYENDIIIAVMGSTGSGKSSFIYAATGDPRAVVGHTLSSCTSQVQAIRGTDPKDPTRSIVFVDTPGFDDSTISDADVLRKIAMWLDQTFRRKVKLSGLLYFHCISDIRMYRTRLQNLKLFKRLCGKDAWQNVTFVTTMWDEVDAGEAVNRENELREYYWKSMIIRGARTRRFHGSLKQAWEIVHYYRHTPKRALLLQKEMVEKNLPLQHTSAGKVLSLWLHDLVEAVKKSLATLEGLARRAVNLEGLASKVLDAFHSSQSQINFLSRQAIKLRTPGEDLSSMISCYSESADFPLPPACIPHVPSRASTFPTNSPSLVSNLIPPSEATILDVAVYGLRLALRTTGPIYPLAKPVLDIIISIWDNVRGMEGNRDALFALVQDATYFIRALVEQATATGITMEMRLVIQSCMRDMAEVQAVLAQAAARNALTRFVFQPEDEVVIKQCHNAIKNAIDAFQMRAIILVHQDIKRLQARVDNLARSTL